VDPHPERDEEAGEQADAVARAPDADRADDEQLEVGEVELEHDPEQRQAVVRGQEPAIVRPPPGDGKTQKDQRQPDSVHRDRDAADPAVLRERDLLAPFERAAVRQLASQLHRRQVRRDRQPDDVETGEDESRMGAAQPPPGGAEDGHGVAAAIAAARSA
jgi:hypothetical protein